MGIFKDPSRRFERNAMFPRVDAILVLIPRKNHLYIQNRSTLACGPHPAVRAASLPSPRPIAHEDIHSLT